MPQRILALEIADGELTAAAVEASFRDYRVTDVVRQGRDAAAAPAADEVRAFLEAHGLTEADIVLSALPGTRVSWRTLRLPFRDRKRLEQTLPFELESHVPFDLDEIVIAYHVLQRDREGTTVLAALVQRRDLEAHLQLCGEVGLDPKTVDLAPLASLNALRLIPERPPICVYVDLRTTRITAALVRDDQLAGLRTITLRHPLGGTTPSGNGASPEGAGFGHALSPVEEIRWTLLSLAGGPLADDAACYLTGPPDEVAALRESLATALGVPVHAPDRLDDVHLEEAARAGAPTAMSCLGLALSEVTPTSALTVNFRRGEYAYVESESELRRGLSVVAALAAVVIALMVVGRYLEFRALGARAAAVEQEVYRVFGQTIPDAPRVSDPAGEVQLEIDALEDQLDAINDVLPSTRETSLDILRILSSALPRSLVVEVDEYSMDTDAVRIRGSTDTFAAADEIKQRLEDAEFFAQVEMRDVKQAPRGGGVDFRLRLTLPKRGGREEP